MRVVTPEWDLCLYKRGPREFFSSFHHVRTQVCHPEQGPHPTVLATTQAQTPSLQNCRKQIPAVDELLVCGISSQQPAQTKTVSV